jgi:hypothetical protein
MRWVHDVLQDLPGPGARQARLPVVAPLCDRTGCRIYLDRPVLYRHFYCEYLIKKIWMRTASRPRPDGRDEEHA